MDKLIKLVEDIGKLIVHYYPAYLTGIRNTLILAIAATVAGCIIGLVCGVGDPAAVQSANLTCQVVGDQPEKYSLTVDGNTITLKTNEETSE